MSIILLYADYRLDLHLWHVVHSLKAEPDNSDVDEDDFDEQNSNINSIGQFNK